MPLWITNATELLPRVALSVNVSLPIWRSRRTDIPYCPCWQIWLQVYDDLFRWGGLPGSVVPYTTYCFVRKGGFDCQQLSPHMNCLVNTYKELIVRTPYWCNLLNRYKKHRIFLFVKDENWKGTLDSITKLCGMGNQHMRLFLDLWLVGLMLFMHLNISVAMVFIRDP